MLSTSRLLLPNKISVIFTAKFTLYLIKKPSINDELEQHPDWYERRLIEAEVESLETGEKSIVTAWIYFRDNQDMTVANLELVESGRFKEAKCIDRFVREG